MNEVLTVRHPRQHHVIRGITVVLGYLPNHNKTDLEPALVLLTSRKRASGASAWAIALSSAAKYCRRDGLPTMEFLKSILPDMMDELDLTTESDARSLLDVVCNFMPDLIAMPPVSDRTLSETIKNDQGRTIGEGTLIAGGRTIAEQEITTNSSGLLH